MCKDLLVYLSMQDVLDRMEVAELVWQLEEVTYGSWEEGPNGDSTWSKTLQLDVPEVGCVCARACVSHVFAYMSLSPFTFRACRRMAAGGFTCL